MDLADEPSASPSSEKDSPPPSDEEEWTGDEAEQGQPAVSVAAKSGPARAAAKKSTAAAAVKGNDLDNSADGEAAAGDVGRKRNQDQKTGAKADGVNNNNNDKKKDKKKKKKSQLFSLILNLPHSLIYLVLPSTLFLPNTRHAPFHNLPQFPHFIEITHFVIYIPQLVTIFNLPRPPIYLVYSSNLSTFNIWAIHLILVVHLVFASTLFCCLPRFCIYLVFGGGHLLCF